MSKPVPLYEGRSPWASGGARTHVCLFLLHVRSSFHPNMIPKPGRAPNSPQEVFKVRTPTSFLRFIGQNHQRGDVETYFWVLFGCLPPSSAPIKLFHCPCSYIPSVPLNTPSQTCTPTHLASSLWPSPWKHKHPESLGALEALSQCQS